MLFYRGGVVSSFFITARSLPHSRHAPSREGLASRRGRCDSRHMMGLKGEAEQSELDISELVEREQWVMAETMGRSAKMGSTLVGREQIMERSMTQLENMSTPSAALDQNSTLICIIEMSLKSWL